METTKNKQIRLPNGEAVPVKVTPPPERSIINYTTTKCRFHLPLSEITANLAQDIWPSPEVLNQPAGTNTLANPWTGSRKDWAKLLREDRSAAQEKRKTKIQKIRRCQMALRKLDQEDWEALQAIFSIHRKFTD